jgi:hypothetical protein
MKKRSLAKHGLSWRLALMLLLLSTWVAACTSVPPTTVQSAQVLTATSGSIALPAPRTDSETSLEGAVVIGAFDDDGVRQAAGMPAAEQPLCIVPVGKPP